MHLIQHAILLQSRAIYASTLYGREHSNNNFFFLNGGLTSFQTYRPYVFLYVK